MYYLTFIFKYFVIFFTFSIFIVHLFIKNKFIWSLWTNGIEGKRLVESVAKPHED